MHELILPPGPFLAARTDRVVLDVRSPGEYAQGHIPGAVSFPLFDDLERARVGTVYKQQGKEEAMLLGLKIVGPKMEKFVRQARKLAPHRRLAVHCWRGGQRSGSMAWLFRQSGFDVVTLLGGYKNYRRHLLDAFEQIAFPMIVIGGQTGSGKTKVLRELQRLGEQIIDLEALAHHKGSAFGAIGELPQPTVEQFENDLFEAMIPLDPGRRVWLENESRSIGRVFVPEGFWRHFKASPLYNIEVPSECRIQNLVDDYTGFSSEELEEAFLRIEKKTGRATPENRPRRAPGRQLRRRRRRGPALLRQNLPFRTGKQLIARYPHAALRTRRHSRYRAGMPAAGRAAGAGNRGLTLYSSIWILDIPYL